MSTQINQETPRTDAQIDSLDSAAAKKHEGWREAYFTGGIIDFARRLEIEAHQLRTEADDLARALDEASAALLEKKAECAALPAALAQAKEDR